MSDDITPILKHWPYCPGEITARKIVALDGRPLVQLRLDLGMLQMEMTGRPDGQQPFGVESLLDHHRARLEQHKREHGSDAGFTLNAQQCADLREESVQYYHRYLSLYHLEEFEGVVADTRRNLECLDFVRAYAAEDSDRMAFEQYRPYILMMHTRARAALVLKVEQFDEALTILEEGMTRIREFLNEVGRADLVDESMEIDSLRRLEREIRRRRPTSPVDRLRQELAAAVSEEDYERAALLRDKLRRLETKS